jgi:hypothetical protein
VERSNFRSRLQELRAAFLRKQEQHPSLWLALAALIALSLIIITWLFLNWYIAPTTPGERKDLTQTLAQIVAGIGFFGTLYFTWRTVQVNREGQVTERFTKAITQLGDEKLEIRLGGIYALERISRDSTRDYGPIMEVLTAYVRDKAPWPTEEPPEGGQEPPQPTRPPTDIQAVLTTLGRRAHPLPRLDLTDTNLRGANLEGADFEGANLRGANLEEAILWRANLWRADLLGANLQEAYLLGANLEGATLWGTYLRTAHGLTKEQIDQAEIDDTTILPEDLQ